MERRSLIKNIFGKETGITEEDIKNKVIGILKESVFIEAFRVLRTGGRLMVSDLVLIKELPDAIRESVEAYVGCLAGAIFKEKYLDCIKKAGFTNIRLFDTTFYKTQDIRHKI